MSGDSDTQDIQSAENNTSYHLKSGTSYDTIHIRFPERRYLPRYFTFEGIPRCGICHILWAPTHRESCPERILPRGAYTTCGDCGTPFQDNTTGRKNRKRHEAEPDKRCRGAVLKNAWQPIWDNTLRCPFCGIPGWTWEALSRHASKCTGDREVQAKSRGETVSFGPQWWFPCARCGGSFLYVSLFDHVCESMCEPVWLGLDGVPPSLSITYLDWCSRVPAPYGPCGFNGVHVGPNGEGAIRRVGATQEQLVAESYTIPWTTNGTWDLSATGKILRLVKKLRRLLIKEEQLRDETDGNPDEIYDLVDQIAANAQGVDNEAKMDFVQTAVDDTIERTNLLLLRARDITYREIISTACPGYGWKHGITSCPCRSELNLRTVRFRWRRSKKWVDYEMICSTCEDLRRILARWRKRGLYTADGSRLCTAARCFNTTADASLCEHHASEKQRKRIERQVARVTTQKPGWRRRIWKIVSPADMGQFFVDLHHLAEPGWMRHEVWRTVTDSMLSDTYTGPAVFFLDTESIRPSGSDPIILSITVLDARGNTILPPTTVDYGQRIGELCQGVQEQHRSYAIRIYGAQNGAMRTHGTTPQELTRVLKGLGLRRESILVEWSMSGWDWRAVKKLYGDDDLPVTYTRAPDILRAVAYQGPLDLVTVFYLLWPRSPLRLVHHDSDIDTFKLYAVVFRLLSRGQPLPEPIRGHIGDEEENDALPDAFWGEDLRHEGLEELEDWEVESSEEEEDDMHSDYMPSDNDDEEEDETQLSRRTRRRRR